MSFFFNFRLSCWTIQCSKIAQFYRLNSDNVISFNISMLLNTWQVWVQLLMTQSKRPTSTVKQRNWHVFMQISFFYWFTDMHTQNDITTLSFVISCNLQFKPRHANIALPLTFGCYNTLYNSGQCWYWISCNLQQCLWKSTDQKKN